MKAIRNRHPFAPLLCCIAAVACGAAPDGAPPGEGTLADEPGATRTPEAALAEMRATGTVLPLPEDDGAPVPKSQPFINLVKTSLYGQIRTHGGPNSSTHVCFLTGMAGDHDDLMQTGKATSTCWKETSTSPETCAFEDGDSWYTGARLTTNADGFWYLEVSGNTRGNAVCVPHTNFRANSGSVSWISNERAKKWDQFSDFSTDFTMWQGDAVSYPTTLRGQWDGFGEKVYVVQSTTAAGSNKLHVQSDDGDFLERAGMHIAGRSYFVGVPGSGKLVNLWGYNTNGDNVRGNVNSAGAYEMAVGNDTGYATYWLTHKDNAVCYLSYVGGDFDGFGEQVQVAELDDFWRLTAKGTDSVRAKARCMAYDQRG